MSIACQKNYSIIIAGTCPDWTQLLIDPGQPTLVMTAGPSTFTPGSGNIKNFVATAKALMVGIGTSSAFCTATLANYNGPACASNLTLTWFKTGTNFSAGSDTAQVILNAGATSVIANFNGTTVNGLYNFPFTVDDGSITPYNITVSVSVSATVFLGQLADVTLSLSGAIS